MEERVAFPGYRILRKLSGGTRGTVWLSVAETDGKKYVIKELPEGEALEPESYQRLLKLSSPCLPGYREELLGKYPVMEYISGRTLGDYLAECGPIDAELAIVWMGELLEALFVLHQAEPPIIHGDLKLSNVMVTEEGRLKLIDLDGSISGGFRTARLGTLGYAAPEMMVPGKKLTPAADIYSFGICFLQLMLDLPPSAMPVERWRKAPSLPPPMGEIPKCIWELLQRCILPEGGGRYPDEREVLKALSAAGKELQRIHQKKDDRKGVIWKAVLLFGTILILSGAIAGEAMGLKEKEERYDTLLLQANTIADYEEAMMLMPEREEAYRGFLDTLLEDDVLSEKERTELSLLHSGAVSMGNSGERILEIWRKKDPEAFAAFCRRAGEACLFYQESEAKERYREAGLWYGEIPEDPEAELVLSLQELTTALDHYETSESSAALGEECEAFWAKLSSLSAYASGQETDLKLLFWKEALKLCDKQLGRLLVVPGEETVVTFLESLSAELSEEEAGGNDFVRETCEDRKEQLQEILKRIGREIH